MKNLKKFIIIIFILLILILILLGVLKDKDKPEEIKEEQDISNLLNETFVEVDNYNIYYSINNIINEYIMYFKQINGDEELSLEKLDMSEAEALTVEREEGTKSIYNTLDKKYIDKFNISEKDIVEMAEEFKQKGDYVQDVVYNLKIKEMYMADISPEVTIVLVYANINDKEFNFIAKLDLENSTYSIFGKEYIEKYKYTKDTEISSIEISIDSIESNHYNQFTYVSATTDYIVTQYFSNFKDKVLNNTKDAYELLDEEYRNKRYGNYESYEKYVKENYDEIQDASISKYLVNNYEDYTEYVCLDENGRYYIFRQSTMLDYSVILDTYTIELQDFKDKYYKGNEQVKVGMNIEKIIEAINTKDYDYVYNKMDQTFKKNNFDNIETFKEFIANNFYEYNDIEYINFSKEGNTYIYATNIKNMKDENSTKKGFTVIMKLLEDSDFVISFSIE